MDMVFTEVSYLRTGYEPKNYDLMGDEEVCIKMDDLANKDFSHYMTESEYFLYR